MKNSNGDGMKEEKDLKNYNIRTDLVIDILDSSKIDNNIEINNDSINNIDISNILIHDDNNILSKKKGRYITISFKDVTDKNNAKNLEEVLVSELKKIYEYLDIKDNYKCLVIGLGNINSTPDSLGPKVIDNVMLTRYLYEIENIKVDSNYRNVASFIPGVTGVTGIESSDIIKGIIEKIKPDFLIIIDALASSSISRINKTIQISDSGINPGSGVYNNRGELSFNTLGIPVIAIGVPTVIEAFVLVSDTIKYIFKNFSYNKENYNKNKLIPVTLRNYEDYNDNLTKEEKKKLLGEIGTLEEDDIKELIFEVLTPIGYNMMITPKEIDFVIDKLSNIISNAINKSLHKNFDI